MLEDNLRQLTLLLQISWAIFFKSGFLETYSTLHPTISSSYFIIQNQGWGFFVILLKASFQTDVIFTDQLTSADLEIPGKDVHLCVSTQ